MCRDELTKTTAAAVRSGRSWVGASVSLPFPVSFFRGIQGSLCGTLLAEGPAAAAQPPG